MQPKHWEFPVASDFAIECHQILLLPRAKKSYLINETKKYINYHHLKNNLVVQ